MFKVPLGGGTSSSPNKSIIIVGQCSFKLNAQESKPKEWKDIEMICKAVPNNSGNGGGGDQNQKFTLTGEHKHRYVYTVTKN